MTKRQWKRYSGVTVGLLAVAILLIRAPYRTSKAEALGELRVLAATLESLRASETGRYPTPDEFAKSFERYHWTPEIAVDPWGNPYQYRLVDSERARYELFSFGADGAAGGTGPDADIYAAPPSIVVRR